MNKKVLNKIYITLFLLGACAYLRVGNLINKTILTDSGFDNSYSGGGSSSSGSSYSSGSSSSSSSDDPVGTLIGFIAVSTTLSVVYLLARRGFGPKKLDKKISMSEEDIRKIIPNFDLDKFLKDRLADYIKIQIDWSEFNYDGLKENLTDELYNQYCMQLKTLQVKNQRNVMKDFVPYDMMVTSAKEVNGRYEVTYELIIAFVDYIEEKKKVKEGSKRFRDVVHYEMLFVSSSSNNIDKCPSCGAELGDNASEECVYCHNIITKLPDKWVLSKKKVIK